MTNPPDHPSPDAAAPTAAERRAALQRLGALAVLTPPTVLTLLLSPRASAVSCTGPLPPVGCPPAPPD